MNKPYSHTCVRCGNTKFYRRPMITAITQSKNCTRCHKVPDAVLDIFINEGVYARECPKCKSIIKHGSRQTCRFAARKNVQCKSCASTMINKTKSKKIRQKWIPIIGNDRFTYETLARVRDHWNSCDEAEQQRILKLTTLQKEYFWGHLRRKRRVITRANVKAGFMKYRGENHWMKRAKVYLKLLNSCQKYCGDNHWFRNPNYEKVKTQIEA
jgi:hypothetical protein